jgi:hypothetical protein
MSADELLEGTARFLRLFGEQVLPRPGEAQRLQRLLFRRLGDDRPGMNAMRYFPDCNGGWWVNLTELAQELSLMDPRELAEAAKSECAGTRAGAGAGAGACIGVGDGAGAGAALCRLHELLCSEPA